MLCESLERPFLGLLHFDFAISWRRVGLQGVNEPVRRRCHLFDGLIECGLVDARWFRRSTQLADELESGRANLIVGRGWLEVGERFDVSAHGPSPHTMVVENPFATAQHQRIGIIEISTRSCSMSECTSMPQAVLTRIQRTH
jgi:hypothetical protein